MKHPHIGSEQARESEGVVDKRLQVRGSLYEASIPASFEADSCVLTSALERLAFDMVRPLVPVSCEHLERSRRFDAGISMACQIMMKKTHILRRLYAVYATSQRTTLGEVVMFQTLTTRRCDVFEIVKRKLHITVAFQDISVAPRSPNDNLGPPLL